MRLGIVPDEESEEEVERGGDLLVSRGLPRRLRDHRRADRHARRRRGQGRRRDADPGRRPRRPRRDPVAGRERDPAGDRRVPRDPIATVCVAQLGALRPAVDQPRPDPRRRRVEQGARHLLHRRRRPLPARAGPRGHPGRGRRDPGRDDRLHLPPAAGDGRPRVAVRAGALCGGRHAPRRRGDQRRPRRRLRRGLVPARRRARGRVRPGRRRPPRARGVGLGELAGELPAAPWSSSPRAARAACAPSTTGRRREHDDETARPRGAPRGGGSTPEPEDAAPEQPEAAEPRRRAGGEHEAPPPATYAGRRRAEAGRRRDEDARSRGRGPGTDEPRTDGKRRIPTT